MAALRGSEGADAMLKARRATHHVPPLIRLEKSGSMATATQSPEYKIIEDSAGVQHVFLRDGKVYIDVRTSGWAEIEGQVYSWDTVAKDIPVNRLSA
jgi:hypothetical protein